MTPKKESKAGDRVLDNTQTPESVNEPDKDIEPVDEEKIKKSFKKTEKELSPFILDDADMPQLLDHALGFIQIKEVKHRYYGIKILQKINRKNKEGKKFSVVDEVPAIIMDDGRILSEHTTPCDFKFISVMTLRNSRWQLKSIKSFHEGECDNKDISFKIVHEEFKKFYDDSMVYEESEWYDLNSLWDQVTYFQDLLDKSPIIKHEGQSETAKSKGMKISSNLSFNGKKFLKPTPATFFRYRHHNKAMLCIEEAEKLFSDDKRISAEDSQLVEYLNGSYEKGNTVPRQNDKNINQTDEFDPFGFTRIGSIKPLKGALRKRSLNLYMVKSSAKDKRGNVEIPAENNLEYAKARNLAYINGLKNYKIYVKALETVKNDYDLSNRQWLVSRPLIAMAKCIDADLEVNIGKFLAKAFNIRDDAVDETSWKIRLAHVLIETYCQYDKSVFIPTDYMRDKLKENINLNDEKHYRITPNKTTRLMEELSLARFKCRNTKGDARGFEMDFYQLVEILLRNGNVTIEEVLKKVSEVSECQYTDEKIAKWYTDTLTDTLNKEESVRKTGKVSEGSVQVVSPLISDTSDTLGRSGGGGSDDPIIEEEIVEDTPKTPNITKESTSSTKYHSDSAVINAVREKGALGYSSIEFCEKYTESRLKRLLSKGQLTENRKGVLRVLE